MLHPEHNTLHPERSRRGRYNFRFTKITQHEAGYCHLEYNMLHPEHNILHPERSRRGASIQFSFHENHSA
jgi:hypothetical protein